MGIIYSFLLQTPDPETGMLSSPLHYQQKLCVFSWVLTQDLVDGFLPWKAATEF